MVTAALHSINKEHAQALHLRWRYSVCDIITVVNGGHAELVSGFRLEAQVLAG